ncbi:hypothetical protein PGT21_005338 [Puccinia graminis f. sp. tritici]|uniref:Zn(2)-C6 fungal-type domain-containing protein n=1 Tax=Puccinia graminis f. sp. tritici TaxID=56615 RepID=A0A5B0P9S5_PUCGR|nr:hypothetical protein PGT21_005338 [Puccinia graminis f. sp. tritici]KAA1134248.1 hypothetical protein PGTUg99_033751 [Puccinia graminis f. sp. tritici]
MHHIPLSQSSFPLQSASSSSLNPHYHDQQQQYHSLDHSATSLAIDQDINSANNTLDLNKHQLPTNNNPRKRVKTSRACDSCRAKKIRCEPLNNPTTTTTTSQSTTPTCAQCHSHSINCTWFLPIALTRFKPRHPKQANTKDNNNQQSSQEFHHTHQQAHLPNFNPEKPTGHHVLPTELKNPTEKPTSSPAPSPTLSAPQPADDSLPRRQEKIDPRSSDHRIYGNTSMSYIMHSTRSFPVERLGQYDTQYFQSHQVENNGEGFIKVYDQNSSDEDDPDEAEISHNHSSPIDDHSSHPADSPEPSYEKACQPTLPPLSSHRAKPKRSDERARQSNEPPDQHRQRHHSKGTSRTVDNNPRIEPSEIEELLSYYFRTLSPHAPMINEYQFLYLTRKQSDPSQAHPRSILGSSSHSKLLVYTLCGLAAMNHQVSSDLRLRVRRTIESFYRYNEILARCDIKSILGLLAIGFSLEFEIPEAGRICWNAVGTAIRMAQSLGLHRPIESTRHSIVHQELRRRVWSCCVITDRWASAVFGLPMAIDLLDSDNHLTLNDPEYLLHLQQDDQLYLSHFALQSLSILLGKILKSLYTPSGITYLKDELLISLMNELEEWHSRLAIISDPKNLGYLCLAAVAVEFLLFRPFMRAEPSGPKSLKFEMVEEDFDRLISRARKAINWVDSNSYILEGQIIGQYSFFVSCLVQYHSYIGQGSLEALDALGQATKVAKSVQNPDCFVRNRVHDIVQALFSTAVTNRQEVERSRLARSSQLGPGPPHQTDTHKANDSVLARSLAPVDGLDNTNLVNHSQPPDLAAQVKLTKQPMWWWDISGIYDINSTFDALSDAPFRWDGLSHPTGLINWNSWCGSLENTIAGSQSTNQHQSTLPQQQQIGQHAQIDPDRVQENGLEGRLAMPTSMGCSGSAHMEPWGPAMCVPPATNSIPTSLPLPEHARASAFEPGPISTSVSSIHQPVYQNFLNNTGPEVLGFPGQNFGLPPTSSSAPPSQTGFQLLSSDLHQVHHPNLINHQRRFSTPVEQDNLGQPRLASSSSFLIPH